MQLSPVVATLVGVLIGSGLSLLGTAYAARKTFQRENYGRLAVMRMAAYSQFARAIKHETRIYVALAATKGVGPTDSPIDERLGRDRLEVARKDRSDALEDVWIVGAEAVVEASRRWHRAVRALQTGVMSTAVGLSDETFDQLYTACNTARDGFYAAARTDLAIPGTVRILNG